MLITLYGNRLRKLLLMMPEKADDNEGKGSREAAED